MTAVSNRAGATVTALTPQACWWLLRVGRIGDHLRIAARRDGCTLDPMLTDALTVLEAGAEMYRPTSTVPLVPVGTSAKGPVGTLITTKQAAQILVCSDRWVRDLVGDEGPFTRYGDGRRTLVDEDEVQAYAHRKEPAA